MNSKRAAVQTLDWLIAPIEHDSFIQLHLNRKPLRITQRISGYYDGLLNENSLEYAFFAAAKVPGAVEELIGEESPRRCRSYQAAIEAYNKGKSLRIDGIQRFSRELILFCRALEQDFSCPVNINMYLTPSGMQALSRHYDTHDVFVLQIHGQKRWRIFNSPVILPLEYIPPLRCEPRDKIKSFRLERHKDMSAKQICKIADEFVLDRGDLLYLPRGFWHEAEAVADHISCHLTVGIQSFTYADLLAVAIAQVAAFHPELRESLPFGFGTHSDSRDVVQEHAQRIVHGLSEKMDYLTALNEIAEAFIKSRQQFGAGLLRMMDVQLGNEVEVHSDFVVREGLLCRVTVNGDYVALSFGSMTISLPIAFEPAFRFIASNRQFCARNLPGQITDEERVSLIRRLVIEGALLTRPNGETGELASDPNSLCGWLPTQLAFRDHEAILKWLHFGDQSLREPFFTQSVKRLRQAARAQIRTTNLSALSNLPDSVQPSGFVFHISRCGSTLVSNAMRAAEGTIVISEPQPIGEALAKSDAEDGIEPDSANSQANEILKGLVRAYGQIRSGDEVALVIKFSSWNILHLDAVRRIWPGVPVIVIIRDPLEVMASCLEQPPGWMRLKRMPSAASQRFEWDKATITSMTDEQFCAKGIGRFLSVASRNVGPQCRVVDYADLNADTLLNIGNFFGISGLARRAIEQTFLTYSKDASGKKMFVDDREQKQALVTDLMRREVDNWARTEYESLRNQQFVLPMRLAANPES